MKGTYIKGLTLLTLLLFFGFSSKCQVFGFRLKENLKKSSIPFELYNNLVLVPVVLNGKIPLKFILDSGVSSSILFNKDITDLLGVEYTRKITVYGVGEENVVQAFVASDVRLDLPGVDGYRQSILALEEDYLELKNQLGVEVHGIIGYDIFSKFVVEIDYMEKRLVLHDPAYFKPRRRWEELDMSIFLTKPFIKIPYSIDGKEELTGNFIIDTGASHALLIHEASDERIFVPEKRLSAILGKGLTGIIRGNLARIKSAELGSVKFEDIVVSFPDEESYSDSLIYIQKNGTIGGETLSRFRVVFDYMNEKLYLRKTSSTNDDFEYNMSGLEIEAFEPSFSNIRVTSVRKNSPADSVDIRVNDQILVVNGLAGENLKLSTIYQLFNTRPGKIIRMSIKRGDQKLKKKLILRKEI